MALSDFSGVTAGTKATVVEISEESITIEWDAKTCGHKFKDVCDCPGYKEYPNQKPLRDGFNDEDMQYLAFETKHHPDQNKKVTNVNHD